MLKIAGDLSSPKEMIVNLFRNYAIADLPDKYCASFLRLSLDTYMDLKEFLLKTGEIKQAMYAFKHKKQNPGQQMVYKVKSYLLENYGNPEIGDIVQLSSNFNTTKKTLTRHFKKNLGTTASQYLVKIRMRKAYALLSEEKLPVKEVYKLVGYKDVYYFSKLFKKHFGCCAKQVSGDQSPE